MNDLRKTSFDRWFKNRHGEIALGEKPNLPIITFVVSCIVAFVPFPFLRYTAGTIAFGSLFTWAWLEVFSGINYFRRVLGGIVGIILITFVSWIAYMQLRR